MYNGGTGNESSKGRKPKEKTGQEESREMFQERGTHTSEEEKKTGRGRDVLTGVLRLRSCKTGNWRRWPRCSILRRAACCRPWRGRPCLGVCRSRSSMRSSSRCSKSHARRAVSQAAWCCTPSATGGRWGHTSRACRSTTSCCWGAGRRSSRSRSTYSWGAALSTAQVLSPQALAVIGAADLNLPRLVSSFCASREHE